MKAGIVGISIRENPQFPAFVVEPNGLDNLKNLTYGTPKLG